MGMKSIRGRRALVVALTAFLLLSPVGGTAIASSDDPPVGGTAVIGADQEPACLNVLRGACNFAWASWTAGIALPGAYRVTPSLAYEPVLVERVDVRPAPFALTYHIKPGAVWSDGIPVSSDDFIFTHDVLLDPANDVLSRTGYELIERAVRLDAKTVRFEFSRPFVAWKQLFPSVLPKHALDGADFDQIWQTELAHPTTHEPIGSGPFLVTEWAKGDSLTLSRNPRWWGPHAPYLEQIVVEFIPDTNALFEAMLAGRVDVIAPAPQPRLADLRRTAGIVVESGPGLGLEHLDFNVDSAAMPLLQQQWFRQAVAFALDREALPPLLFASLGLTAGVQQSLLYPSIHADYVPHFEQYGYSAQRVTEIMEAHGCARGSDGIWSCPAGRASVKFATTTGNQPRALAQQELVTRAAAAGIELVPDNSPAGVLFGQRLPARDYELIMFTLLRDADPGGLVDLYGCDGSQNFTGYCSPAVTDLLTRSDSELDAAARAALVNEADAILADEAPSIPLFLRPSVLAYHTRLHGPAHNGTTEGPTWNVEEWCVPASADSTPPTTAALLSRPPNANGWHNAPVTVELTADDGGESCPPEIRYSLGGAETGGAVVVGDRATLTVSTEGTTTLTYFARDRAGNLEPAQTLTLYIDKTPPQVAATRTPTANAHGWSNEDVTVRFEATDALSGIEGERAAEAVLSNEGADQSVGRSFTDRAGNRASATVSGIGIDKTPPQVAATRTPAANAHGWSNEEVTVRFEATDAPSGVEGDPAAEAVMRDEGADQSVSRSFTDRAGNQASATVSGVSIDKTAPSISCSASPAILQPPNGSLVPVEVAVTLNDALSGASGFRLVSATSSEGEAALGAGDRPDDIRGFELGAPDTSGALRAERAGAGRGRVYTLEYEGADRSGNVARCRAQVSVPHDSGSLAPRCRVPNVHGKTLARARTAIRLARCRTGKVSRGYSKSIARGRIVKQRPRPATVLRAGAKVNLVVSRGAKPPRSARRR
jgi:peptide/nickel transport system substrate-binding protein